MFEDPVQVFGIFPVLGVRVAGILCRRDRPAVRAVVALLPPTVQHTEVRHAVESRLLAAGSTGFHGGARRVEPHVYSLDEIFGGVHVVVLQEGEAAAQSMVLAEAIDLVNEQPTRLIGRVRFAGKHDLERSPGIVQEVLKPDE